jgi:hypothetical protein
MIKVGDRVRVRDGVVDAVGRFLGFKESYYVAVHLDGDKHPRKVKWSEVDSAPDDVPASQIKTSCPDPAPRRGAGLDRTSR